MLLGSLLFTSIALTSAGVFCVLHQVVFGSGFAATPRFLWLAFGCAIVATVLPSFLINAGLQRVSSQAVSMIATVVADRDHQTCGLRSSASRSRLPMLSARRSCCWAWGFFTWGDSRGPKNRGQGPKPRGHSGPGACFRALRTPPEGKARREHILPLKMCTTRGLPRAEPNWRWQDLGPHSIIPHRFVTCWLRSGLVTQMPRTLLGSSADGPLLRRIAVTLNHSCGLQAR